MRQLRYKIACDMPDGTHDQLGMIYGNNCDEVNARAYLDQFKREYCDRYFSMPSLWHGKMPVRYYIAPYTYLGK